MRPVTALLLVFLQALPPSKYPSLLQQSLETDIFPEIISILHEDYIRCGKLCLEQLRCLTKVKRFSVALMFLSRKEKESKLNMATQTNRQCLDRLDLSGS